MGTHPIFESDFDCLTELEHRSACSPFGIGQDVHDQEATRCYLREFVPRGRHGRRKDLQANSRTHASRRHRRLQPVGDQGLSIIDISWRHYYWVLTNEGIEYLREYLHLPPEIVPVTMKKQAKIVDNKPRGGGRVGVPTAAYSQDQRDQYRREKDANSGPGGAGFRLGGAGRGARGPAAPQ